MNSILDKQLSIFSDTDNATVVKKRNTTTTFADNMALPLHKWYRYTAGFSASWVKELIEKEKANGRRHILDPFAGSGTSLLEAEFLGVESIGIEAHEYVHRIAKAKLTWRKDPVLFINSVNQLLETARNTKIGDIEYPILIQKCFPKETANKLESLKQAWFKQDDDDNIRDLTWFLITSILRPCSPVGTAQWQYIQPLKSKSKSLDPYVAFESKALSMVKDMRFMQHNGNAAFPAKIILEDARNIQSVEDNWADLIITSPPYANNYDYADAMRFEMTFWGDITGWKDLHYSRKTLIRACTQHVSKDSDAIELILGDNDLISISKELIPIYETLKLERLNHGGKKQYHTMIAAYFQDLSKVFQSLRRISAPDSLVCFIIGDSAPYGIYVPVDKWLGELAIAAGFKSYTFEKMRDRNTKWKNRKHRVPLHEGRLWIKG